MMSDFEVEAGDLFEYTWQSGRDPMLLVATGNWNEWQIVATKPSPISVYFLSATITPTGWSRRIRVSLEDLPLYMGWVKGDLFERILKGTYKPGSRVPAIYLD